LLRPTLLFFILFIDDFPDTQGKGETMKAIHAENLVRDFNSLRALDRISFSVEAGEIFGFLGPNGAGKTTTIRILTAQLSPTSGKAWVMGCDVVTERHALKPQIGVVFEYQNLYQRLSARDNLNFTANLYGIPQTWVDEALEQVGLRERANESLKKYSNGMKQRLLIARALLHRPKVLFLDEPTLGLDPNIARDIRAFVGNLVKKGVTVFLTTHYMEEADQLCNRVAIVDHGRIVALDTPRNLKAHYGNGQKITLEDVFVRLTGRQLDRESIYVNCRKSF
jgi:ABC-2 type transport system ATP-binding protein